jgi:hypothetical protein
MSQDPTDAIFTLGVRPEAFRLPHPRLGLPVILVVRRVLLRAFEILFERRFSLVSENEDRVTTALRSVIENDLRQSGSVPGFNTRTYCALVRQAQTENFDLTRLGKAPDLCFKLRNDEEEPRPALSTHDALFVECKPVDANHAAGSVYCDKGLSRFVEGDYAWAMGEAMMIGYARAGRTIPKHLVPAMQKPDRFEALKTTELPKPVEVSEAVGTERAETLHASRHRRGFPWPYDKGPASEIVMYHSWHRCD